MLPRLLSARASPRVWDSMVMNRDSARASSPLIASVTPYSERESAAHADAEPTEISNAVTVQNTRLGRMCGSFHSIQYKYFDSCPGGTFGDADSELAR